jgi:hypothetical protein
MITDSEIKQKIVKDYGEEFWYYSYEDQQAIMSVYKLKEKQL